MQVLMAKYRIALLPGDGGEAIEVASASPLTVTTSPKQ
jgi:hypothetical protein